MSTFGAGVPATCMIQQRISFELLTESCLRRLACFPIELKGIKEQFAQHIFARIMSPPFSTWLFTWWSLEVSTQPAGPVWCSEVAIRQRNPLRKDGERLRCPLDITPSSPAQSMGSDLDRICDRISRVALIACQTTWTTVLRAELRSVFREQRLKGPLMKRSCQESSVFLAGWCTPFPGKSKEVASRILSSFGSGGAVGG